MSTDSRQQKLGIVETSPVNRVDQYEFEPIRGYPMLRWYGKRPFTSTQYYPAQHKETYGPEVQGWRNKLYWGDNLQVMSHLLKEYRGQVKLVYIDPPFDSKADYKRTITLRGKSVTSNRSAFEEKQYSDIWTNDEYLQYMYERLILLRELLADDGSIWLHCDSGRNSYLRIIMDEIFGSESFVNEIVWRRTGTHGTSRSFGVVHDTLLFYGKSASYTFFPQSTPLDPAYIDSHYTQREQDGRRYQLISAHGPGQGPARRFGDRGILAPPVGRHWAYTQEGVDELLAAGRIVFTSTGMPRVKRYADEAAMPIPSIWQDIAVINSQADERLNYPTQKPEQLLERIIAACSEPGDIVLDCFMGSGTTQVAAMKHGRRFIGADINLSAVQITTKRLLAVAAELSGQAPKLVPDEGQPETLFTGFEVFNVNNYDIFRNPVQAKELLIEALEVNPLQPGNLFDGEKDGRMVKVMPVNRIATRQDLNELITGLDYRAFERRQAEHPNQPVERITLVSMGHEPDLAAYLQHEVPFRLDVQVVDILRDKQELQFKRDAEAEVVIRDGELVIEAFYPMNLLAKLSLQKEYVEDWRELVDAVMVDWNYDGAVLQPTVIDVPEGTDLVKGRYRVPEDAGTIRVKITDLLSESLETVVPHA